MFAAVSACLSFLRSSYLSMLSGMLSAFARSPLWRHFGGIRFPEDSARPELIPLDIIFGQGGGRFMAVFTSIFVVILLF